MSSGNRPHPGWPLLLSGSSVAVSASAAWSGDCESSTSSPSVRVLVLVEEAARRSSGKRRRWEEDEESRTDEEEQAEEDGRRKARRNMVPVFGCIVEISFNFVNLPTP